MPSSPRNTRNTLQGFFRVFRVFRGFSSNFIRQDTMNCQSKVFLIPFSRDVPARFKAQVMRGQDRGHRENFVNRQPGETNRVGHGLVHGERGACEVRRTRRRDAPRSV